jgi:riboflavin-specific deaminase-like protein
MQQGDSAARLGSGLDGVRDVPRHASRRIDAEQAWRLVLAVRRRVDAGEATAELAFDLAAGADEGWEAQDPAAADLVVDGAAALVRPGRHRLTATAREILDLHLPLARRPARQGFAGAILGQSLDGFIATREGCSRYINGAASLAHLHRLRALSDAVLIGVSTAVADEPRLTTRHVPGPSPVRVVLDPRGRLPAGAGLLRDGAAPTLVIRLTTGGTCEQRLGERATALHLPGEGGRIEPASIVAALAARGLGRLLVEGGGRTVSCFLEAGLLDRLQLAISPLILGAGRPALPIAPVERLDQALRPAARRYLMGEDVLFDLELRPPGSACATARSRPRRC